MYVLCRYTVSISCGASNTILSGVTNLEMSTERGLEHKWLIYHSVVHVILLFRDTKDYSNQCYLSKTLRSYVLVLQGLDLMNMYSLCSRWRHHQY